MSLHLAPLRSGAALAVILGAAGATTPSFALDPWFDHIFPRYFFSGFEQSDTQGFTPNPLTAWHVENGNTYAVDDLGCDTAGHSWIQSGFVWTDYILQVSVQDRIDPPFSTPGGADDRGNCSAVGIHFRRTDFDNYYLFVLRGGEQASLLRVQDGVIDRELDVPFPYTSNRWYVLRVRLEGDHVLGYVNGTPVIEWNDDAHVRGTGGPSAWGTAAWFDNVISMPLYPIPHSGRPRGRDVTRDGEQSAALDRFLQWFGTAIEPTDGFAGDSPAHNSNGIESWPQPTTDLAYLRFFLEQTERVQIEIFDASGRHVRSLLEGSLGGGTHDLIWDGRDDFGAVTGSGIYYARLITRDQVSGGRIVRVR